LLTDKEDQQTDRQKTPGKSQFSPADVIIRSTIQYNIIIIIINIFKVA